MKNPPKKKNLKKELFSFPKRSLHKVNIDFKYKHHWVLSVRDDKIAHTIEVLISLTSLMNIEYIITSLIDMDALKVIMNLSPKI